jgi:hypothetical protein
VRLGYFSSIALVAFLSRDYQIIIMLKTLVSTFPARILASQQKRKQTRGCV